VSENTSKYLVPTLVNIVTLSIVGRTRLIVVYAGNKEGIGVREVSIGIVILLS
jgi:hypothetical protein